MRKKQAVRVVINRAVLLALCSALAWTSVPAWAQDSQANYQGILKKREKQLRALLTGRFVNKEQSAFAAALTPEGDLPFETLTSLRLVPSGDALEIDSSETSILGAGEVTILISGDKLQTVFQGETYRCVADAEPLLDGFSLVFKGRKSLCPLNAGLAVMPQGISLEKTRQRPAIHMTRAREFSCWLSIPRADKSWFFIRDVKLHDQGGIEWVETDEETPQKVGVTMRNAVWPYGSSRPSLVLYVLKAENPNRAASYAWAEPDSERIGINLRWMQGSCTTQSEG